MEKLNIMTKVKPLVDIKIIKETLTRLGIQNSKKKFLYPSCYMYQNFDDYYILHFKELFTMTRPNGYNNLSLEDIERKNSIIFCLKNWGLVDVDEETIVPHSKYVFVLPYSEKSNWKIIHKWNTSGYEMV